MQIKVVEVGYLQTNCYFVIDEKTMDTAVIDPGDDSNKILDAIEKNGGYCPCQAGKSEDTKCHCKDFKENKKIGEPCICKIFVKQKLTLAATKKKLAAKKKVKK